MLATFKFIYYKKLNSKHFELFQIVKKLKKHQLQENRFKDIEILKKLSSKLHYEIEKLTNSKRDKNSLYHLVK